MMHGSSLSFYVGWTYFSWWALGACMIIQTVLLLWQTRRPLWKCLLIAALVGAVMGSLGKIAYIFPAALWELVITTPLEHAFATTPLSFIDWISTLVFAAYFSTGIFWAIMKISGEPVSKQLFWLVFTGNLLLTRIALFTHPDLSFPGW